MTFTWSETFSPDIVILEIGTNDLTHTPPEIVGSNIDDLVRLLVRDFAVRAVGVCGVIPRGISVPHALSLLGKHVSFESICWRCVG